MNTQRITLLLAVGVAGLIASVGADCETVVEVTLPDTAGKMDGDAALSVPEFVESSTKTKGATTITWDSSFQDPNYTVGETVTLIVNWNVDAGAAAYDDPDYFGLRRVTPRSKKDPAEGALGNVSRDANSVTVDFAFTELHLDRRRNVEIGNAHLKLYLMIDEDGDGALDTRAGYGVNLHVEDPQ